MELFKKDSRGCLRVWRIEMEEDGLLMEYGKVDGAIIEEYEEITQGKGGRSLEEQIESRYNSRINKKIDAGYVDSIDKIGKRSLNSLGFDQPTKAKLYQDVKPRLSDGAFIQAKYNGHRCCINRRGGEATPYSKNGKVINSIDHLLDGIGEGPTLDGELYIHGMSLQKISSLVRKKQEGSLNLTYVIYDIMTDEPYSERLTRLNNLVLPPGVIVASTQLITSEAAMWCLFDELRASGYEGAMLRRGEQGYEYGKRSSNLIKVKKGENDDFILDDEFLVIDVIPSAHGWGRLVCEAANGKEFKMSAPGTFAQKTEILKNKHSYIGKKIRAEYSELTDDGKPSHPTAIMFREEE